MLTSGIIGRQNIKWALGRYRDWLCDLHGKAAGDLLFSSTAAMPFDKRLWRLDALVNDGERATGKSVVRRCRGAFWTGEQP